MSKRCIHCGAELPQEASFCPVCAKSQVEKTPVKGPRHWRRKLAAALCGLAVAAAAAVLLWYFLGPRTYRTDEAMLVYTIDGEEYTILLTTNTRSFLQAKPEKLVTNTIPAGVEYAFPSLLNVFRADTGEDMGDAFLAHVKRCTVTAIPREGSKEMLLEGPHAFREVFPNAAQMCDVYYNAESGTNDVVWRLEMDNRDVLELTQTFQIEQSPTVTFSYQATPMNNLEQLQALLDRIAQEEDPTTAVEIILPPIPYEGGVTIRDRSVTLRGSTDEFGRHTSFHGPIQLLSELPNFPALEDLYIEGDGTGTGVTAQVSCYVTRCSITGWEVGVSAEDGSWVIPDTCVFQKNGVGFRFNSNRSNLATDVFKDNIFAENGVGVELINVPGMEILDMTDCVFSGNGEDIRNTCGRALKLPEGMD